MNVTREVVTDLLPVYFAGEASGDTRSLVEDYFRQDPDFERIARSAATPLESLRGTAPMRPEAEREKRDLQNVRCELQRRKWYFGFALFFTLAPLAFAFKNGHISWLMIREAPWDAVFYWGLAVLYWVFYFARAGRRTTSLVAAIFFTLLPSYFALHLVFAGAPALRGNLVEAAAMWIAATVCWFEYFWKRR
ncbi:MAG TPA: hypothetical protein VKT50_02770 [Candidatus Acidoferrales bacterium]|nr:hypothetical protein [Candidatus Acidoferrales bacterium]